MTAEMCVEALRAEGKETDPAVAFARVDDAVRQFNR